MTEQRDPFSLLAILKQRFEVGNVPLHGPSLIVPNSDFKPGWNSTLEKAGFRVFSGEREGRIT
jgi:hypothetical protein